MEITFNDPRMRPDKLGQQSGYVLDQFSIFEHGELIAYMKVGYKTRETVEKEIPTMYHFLAKSGWCLEVPPELRKKEDIFDHVHSRILPWEMRSRQDKSCWPVEQKIKAMERFENSYEGRIGAKNYSEDLDYFIDRPYIDYARVLESHQRRRLATKLYNHVATHYKERGMELRASGCQSEDAKALWAYFEKQGWVRSQERKGKIERFFIPFQESK